MKVDYKLVFPQAKAFGCASDDAGVSLVWKQQMNVLGRQLVLLKDNSARFLHFAGRKLKHRMAFLFYVVQTIFHRLATRGKETSACWHLQMHSARAVHFMVKID